MQNAERLTPEQIREFLQSSQGIEFVGQNRAERYEFVQRVLVAQEYAVQSKKQRGTIRGFLSKVTGLSLPQITRLIRKYRQSGVVEPRAYRRRRFPSKYTNRDVELLAEVDRAHGWLSGPATVRILKREFEQYGKAEYARLAGISVSHLYNLRHSNRYRKMAAEWKPTQPTAIAIGERRKPDPQGRPGFVRIDTVHQGDWEGAKGVYHINAVDAVTQWQVVGCVERINEQFLLPVLEAMLLGRKRAMEMPGPWKAWKSKSSFPTLPTAPWKSRPQREIPTFPQPGFAVLEKWKTKNRFPTFPPPLARTIPAPSLQDSSGSGMRTSFAAMRAANNAIWKAA